MESRPRRFGDYVLLEPLAHGGMGEVWLARQEGFAGVAKLCVVKTIRADFTDDADYVARFVDEARTVVELAHGNICHVFDVGSVAGRYYLAMEHVAGRDLNRIRQRASDRGERLPARFALHVVGEILDALDYAHALAIKIVHRDISPQNILVSFDGQAKLIDFGLAASTKKRTRTEAGIVIGKLAYMSPEQACDDDVDARTDQFAMAVVLFELLSGEAFYASVPGENLWAVVSAGAFRPPLELVPADVRAPLTRALAADREQRFATCGEFRSALLDTNTARVGAPSRAATKTTMDGLFPGDAEAEHARRATLAAQPIGGERTEVTQRIALSSLAEASTVIASAPAASEAAIEATVIDTLPVAVPAKPIARPAIARPAPLPRRAAVAIALGVLVAAAVAAIALAASPTRAPVSSEHASDAAPPQPDARVDAGEPSTSGTSNARATRNASNTNNTNNANATPDVVAVVEAPDAGAAALAESRGPAARPAVRVGARRVERATAAVPPALPADDPHRLVDRLAFLGAYCKERAPSCAPKLSKRMNDDLVKLASGDLAALAEQTSACLKLCRAKP